MIQLENVNKHFKIGKGRLVQQLEVLSNITFSVGDGEIVSLIGPSGCGKSTLLRIAAGLETRDSGSIAIDGNEISSPGRDRGLVFQAFNLFPWMSVMDNVAFGVHDLPREEQVERAMHYIQLVGLAGFETYHPHQLSGGMQQRVGIARALAIEPKVLLLDEPLANVDSQTGEVLIDEFLKIFEETKKTVIYVTHDIDEAIYIADKSVVLSSRPGQIRDVLEIKLPKPRWKYDVRAMPEFGALRSKLRQSLRLGTR
jgi:NitT/TauT family transport system ATP-binding protein